MTLEELKAILSESKIKYQRTLLKRLEGEGMKIHHESSGRVYLVPLIPQDDSYTIPYQNRALVGEHPVCGMFICEVDKKTKTPKIFEFKFPIPKV